MARAVNTDFFHRFRFAPQVGFDGEKLGVCEVAIRPGTPWGGKGYVEIATGLTLESEFVNFARINQEIPLVIGLYHITDDFSTTGTPSARIVLSGVVPSRGTMTMSTLDSTADEIFKLRLRMEYDRLTFLFGDGADCVLDQITAVT